VNIEFGWIFGKSRLGKRGGARADTLEVQFVNGKEVFPARNNSEAECRHEVLDGVDNSTNRSTWALRKY
jgi:hypothetical protein